MSTTTPHMADGVVRSRGRSFYLELEPDPVFAIAHEPDNAADPALGVVICPPFGWDELCTRRSMRSWADVLAQAGYMALRIDLPGSGDSGGSARDPGRLGAWLDAISRSADWLRLEAGCGRVVAFGIGMSGMLSLAAAERGAAIDDLILWSVPARGRTMVRELRAFARIAAGEGGEAHPPEPLPPEDGVLEVAGFVLSAETVGDLERLDLSTVSLPEAAGRRVLLLGRDTVPADRALAEHLAAQGVELTVAAGHGYARMITHPQFAETPYRLFGEMLDWLAPSAAIDAPVMAVPREPVTTSDCITLRVGEALVREAPFEFEHGDRRLTGILTTPDANVASEAPITVVLLNAGAIRRIGPNRMWVEAARRWAANGLPTLRFDAAGLGDADGDEVGFHANYEFYRDEFAGQVRAALDELEAAGLPGRFLVGGLCSGAYWSFHAGLADDRIVGLMLVNIWSFFWSEEIAAARDARRARQLLRAGSWREVLEIALTEGRIFRMLRTRAQRLLRRERGDRAVLARLGDTIDSSLGLLRDRDVRTLLLLSLGEPLVEDFETDGRIDRFDEWPNIDLQRIPLEDHVFRPVWAQRQVHETLDAAVERTLADAALRGIV